LGDVVEADIAVLALCEQLDRGLHELAAALMAGKAAGAEGGGH